MTHTRAATLVFLALASAAWAAQQAKPAPEPIQYGLGRKLCELANPDVDESSGLACSRRTPGVFWTHNDSGDYPYVYAFNAKGEDLGTYRIEGAINRDWEDMASVTLGGKHYLLIADVGDNAAERDDCTLYVVPEPPADPKRRGASGKVKAAMAIDFRYEDGPRNCEAVAIDPTTRTVYLVAKCAGEATVHALPLPKRATRDVLVARPVATVRIPMATAMDISPDGLRAVVLTYGNACEYTRRPEEKWSEAFSRPARNVRVPPRRQGESICYALDGRTLYLTSEKTPTPLLEVPVVKAR